MTIISTELPRRIRDARLCRHGLLGCLDPPERRVARPRTRRHLSLHDALLITTDSILVEVLNVFAEHGDEARLRAVSAVEEILTNAHTEVVPQTHENFLAGLELYKARADKGYSLTDCISMTAMRERHITDVLTHDHHFTQEGFTPLF